MAENPTYEPLAMERVIDGDTFVASGIKIRLWGIDAPERDEPLYQHSRQALVHFLESGSLTCSQVDTDRYGRSVMQCDSDQEDVGALMVRAGFAKDFARYSKGFYAAEEDEARRGHLGIWQ
jgi:endonuclease YncB( thermonuclease family)